MQKDSAEWRELCRQASVEQDPQKLMQLIQRIVDLLESENRRLNPLRSEPADDPEP